MRLADPLARSVILSLLMYLDERAGRHIPPLFVTGLTVGLPGFLTAQKSAHGQTLAGADRKLRGLAEACAAGLYALVLANDCCSSQLATSVRWY